jgi:hypothetical protein
VSAVSAEARAEVLPETELDGWARLARESPDGGVYALPEYLDVLCRFAGGRFRVLAVRQGGELAGGVALYERDSRYGAYVAPRRLLHYNGLVLRRYPTRYPSEQTARGLKTMAALAGALAARRYAWATLLCPGSVVDVRPLLAAGWSASPRFTYVVALGDRARLWSRIEHNLKRLIKRCEAEGVAMVEDDDVETCYRLHADTMRRTGQEPYLPERAFRGWFEALRAHGLARLFHARHPDGRALASQLVLLGGPRTHTVVAGTDFERRQMGGSAFLRWKAFDALADAGYASNDLTDASLGPVAHFKSQLGGDLELCLSLDAPRAWRFRLGHGLATGARRALAAARGRSVSR